MKKSLPIKRQVSSGGVIFHDLKGNIEIALVAVKDKTVWCLPKGLVDNKERPEMTALREVREETGLTGQIIDKIGQISYWYFSKEDKSRIHKVVHFYLLRYLEGSTEDHDYEVDEAKWFNIDEAMDKLSYKGEKEILQKAKEMISKIQSSKSKIQN